MEWMFEGSVTGILGLIEEQVAQIRVANLRVKTIFLSGGYSRSEHLQNRVTAHAGEWRCNVFWGTDSWTAVAKGGVLMGLGVGCDKPEDCVTCPFSIGVVLARPFRAYVHEKSQQYTDSFDGQRRAKGHIDWVIAKGDLITKTPIEKTVRVIRKLSPGGFTEGRVIVVTSTDDSEEGPPKRLSDRTSPITLRTSSSPS